MAKTAGGFNLPPKLPKSVGKNLIDYDKLKEIYLSGPDYDWTPFCNRQNYNAKSLRALLEKKGIDFSEWKRSWLKKQAQLHDEELAPEILDLRKAVSLQRVKFVKDWTTRTQYMKSLFDAILRQHGDALQHDIKNTLAIQAGKERPKFNLDSKELSNLAGAAQRLQEIETRSLMLTGDKLTHPQILAGGAVGYAEDEEDGEYNAPTEMHVATMGSSGMSAAQTAKLLAQWFDQKENIIETSGDHVDDDKEDNS